MSAMITLPVRPEGWTVDDLGDLPGDDGLRYELVDGALLVSPSPPNRHNIAATELVVILHAALDRSWRIAAPGSVRFDRRNYREPDLIVLRSDGVRFDLARPQDVLLAVEIMSPGSISNDRVAKPAQYAAAGIAHYWRLERGRTPVLITHELKGTDYRETGRFTDQVAIDRPVEVRFRLGDLLS
jgi:Uma2 family endonuclease